MTLSMEAFWDVGEYSRILSADPRMPRGHPGRGAFYKIGGILGGKPLLGGDSAILERREVPETREGGDSLRARQHPCTA